MSETPNPQPRQYRFKDAPLVFKAIGDRVVAGTASVEVVDHHGDLITMEAFSDALSKFMERPNIMAVHTSAQVGEAIPEFTAADGTVHRTGVFDGVFRIVARVFDDIAIANEIWDAVLDGTLGAFSIGGQALANEVTCSEGACFNRITAIDLFEVSIVERPANPGAFFDVLSKSLVGGGGPCESGCGCDHKCDSGRCCMDKTFDKTLLLIKEAGREIQSLTLDPASFSLTRAITWVLANGFEAEFKGAEPSISDSGSIVFIQRDSTDFVSGSLVSIELRPGVTATIGTLKDDQELAIGGGNFTPSDQKHWIADVVEAIRTTPITIPTFHLNITPPKSPRSAEATPTKETPTMSETETVDAPPVDTAPPEPVSREEFDTLKSQVTDGFAKTFDALSALTESLKEKAEEPEPTPEPPEVEPPAPEPENDENATRIAELEAKVKALSAPAKEAIAPAAPPPAPTEDMSNLTWKKLGKIPMLADENGRPRISGDAFVTPEAIYKQYRGGN